MAEVIAEAEEEEQRRTPAALLYEKQQFMMVLLRDMGVPGRRLMDWGWQDRNLKKYEKSKFYKRARAVLDDIMKRSEKL